MTASPAILNGRCHCLEKCDSDIKRICQKMRIDKVFEMRAHHEWIWGFRNKARIEIYNLLLSAPPDLKT